MRDIVCIIAIVTFKKKNRTRDIVRIIVMVTLVKKLEGFLEREREKKSKNKCNG